MTVGKLVLATRNKQELAELRRILEPMVEVEVLSLDDLPPFAEAPETGATFAENALSKAQDAAAATDLPAGADDSGLAVDAPTACQVSCPRDGRAGMATTSPTSGLLAKMEDVPEPRRGAAFVCAAALVIPGGVERVVEADMRGRIVEAPRGDGRFGYDPTFVPDGHCVTSAELTPGAKDAISRRGKALRALGRDRRATRRLSQPLDYNSGTAAEGDVVDESSRGELTRRGFLVLGGGAATVAGLAGCWPAATETATGPPVPEEESEVGSSAVLSGGYPRVLAFRQSETLVSLSGYAQWSRLFSPFVGIVGKALPEERSDRGQVLDYFNRFKQQNPGKVVLLHHNGRARLPTFETSDWSAGWWLYRAGSVSTSALTPRDNVVRVESTGPFGLGTDRIGETGDDVVIAPMGPGGKPDFSQAEHVRVTHKSEGSLTVRRGLYGSSTLSFAAGAYVAPHVTAGPWSEVDDRVWFYNLTAACPPDASGRRVVDVLLAQFADWFAADGLLAGFDGIQLDVFDLEDKRERVDADCDGLADSGRRDGVDLYLQGQIELTEGMRRILGPSRYLITDSNVGQQPDMASVNGVELEGFPTSSDYAIELWSQALMTLDLWRRHGPQPRLSYPVFQYRPPNDYPISFNRFRLALAASLATNAAITWGNEPGGSDEEARNVVGIWDEFVRGTGGQAGWLGTPRGDTIHLAERTPDLLAGAGVSWSHGLLDTFSGPEVTFEVHPPAADPVLLVSARQPAPTLTFTIPARPLDGPDVVLALDVMADRRAAYPATIGRLCTVTVAGTSGTLTQLLTVPTNWFRAVLGFHEIGPGPIQITLAIEGGESLSLRALRMFAAPHSIARGFAKGAVFANPSRHDVTFNVAELFPDRRFARIVGSPGQDPVANDGRALGSTLKLPARDALVVRSV